MSWQLGIILLLLASAVVMFAINKPRMDAVALLMITIMPFTGVLTMGEALQGFADSNIVLIAALFVIGDGLVRTGVARRLGDWLIEKAGTNQTVLISLLMVVVCGLGATMSSTAVTAIFIPVGLRIAQRTGAPASKLMMPLSFAALISGMTTLVATAPNLVVNGELQRQGMSGFSFFSFTPFGVPILILGIGYMLIARRWLPDTSPDVSGARGRPSLADWVQKYKLAQREHSLRVSAGSSLVGRTLAELNLRGSECVNILGVERSQGRRRELIEPTSATEIRESDVLLVDLQSANVEIEPIAAKYSLERLPLSAGGYFSDRSEQLGLAEAIVPADSDLVGKTVVESRLRSRTGLTVIGLRHGRTAHEGGLLAEPLQVGDTLLVVGTWSKIEALRPEDAGLHVLNKPAEADDVLPVPGKAIQAVMCLLVVVGLMISGVIPNVQAAFIGCLLMGVFGIITLQSAYRSIDWKTLVLIVGMLPFSIALQRTGGVDIAAGGLQTLTEGAGPRVVLACLFIITASLGLFISNTATAVLMAPVAVALAKELGMSPYPFAMIVALAASTAFMTPVSSPVNTLVVGPGNYKFGDFVKIGVPFSIIVLIVSVVMVPMLLPLDAAEPAAPKDPIGGPP